MNHTEPSDITRSPETSSKAEGQPGIAQTYPKSRQNSEKSVFIRWKHTSKGHILDRIVHISENVKDMLGFTASDFISGSVSFSELIAQEDAARIKKAFQNFIKNKEPFLKNSPYRLKSKAGSLIWVNDYITPGPEANSFQGFIVQLPVPRRSMQGFRERMTMLNDVINQLNRAKSLKEVYEITARGASQLLNASRSSVLIFGPDRLVHFVAWQNLSENYRKMVDGHCPWHIDQIDAKPIFISDVEKSSLQEELKQAILDEGIHALGFFPLISPDHLLGKFMVYYDQPHEFREEDKTLAQILSDNLSAIITRMQALEEAQKSEAKYRAIFENINEGIYQTTEDGTLLTVNPALARMLGYDSVEQMLAISNIKEHYWDASDRERLLRKIKSNGVLRNVEVKMKRRDGSPIWMLMNDRPVFNEKGELEYYEGTLTDITERKKIEENIQQLNTFQQLILNFAIEYMNVPLDEFDEKINEALKTLGEFTGVDRVYLFDYDFENNTTTNTHEWCAPGIEPQIENLQEIPNHLLPDWVEMHKQGKMIHIKDVNHLPEDSALRKILEPQQIKTLITVPIMQKNRCIGFVGFDSVRHTRQWTENEITLLWLFAGIISNARERMEKEETLRSREEQLSVLINSTPDLICFKDAQGRWLESNEANLQLFEIMDIDYYGKKDSELAKYSPFYRDAFLTCEMSDEKAWEKRTISRTREIIPRSDGTTKIFDVIKVPIFNEDGSRRGLVVFGRDITDQQEAEKRLQRQLHFSRALNDLARHILLESSPEKVLNATVRIIGEALELDRCMIYQADLTRNEVRAITERISPSLRDRIPLTPYFKLSEFSESSKFILEKRTWLVSHKDKINPLLAKEGSADFLHGELNIKSLLWYPLFLNETDLYLLVYNSFERFRYWEEDEIEFTKAAAHMIQLALQKIRFIEEQRKAAAEIKRLATLVEQSTSSITITDVDGRIQYVNKAFEKATGFSADEIKGTVMPIFHHDLKQEIIETVMQGQVWRGRWVNHKKDGSSYHEEVVIFPIKDEHGNIVNFCKSARNIDHEIRLEEQLRQAQKMEAVGQLAGGVAHDFNNLLTIINGYADLVMNNLSPDDRNFRAISAILEAGKRAATLTNQLLAFSRKQIVKQEVLDLNQVIINLQKMLRRLIGEDIQMEFKLHEPLPSIVADRSQLEQILINLVVNARDAVNAVDVPEFSKRIIIETETREYDSEYAANHAGMRPGKYVILMVSDNGIGMDEITKQRIFEPFFTTKEQGKGTGLGMSMVYGIVKQNNGTIYVYSERNYGTTIKINWPVARKKSASNQTSRSKKLDLTGSETILLVEDFQEVQNFAKQALSMLGYKIYAASNGREALELIENLNFKPDLLITDLIMPEMNGKDLANRLQKKFNDLKVIFVSGYSDNHIIGSNLAGKEINFIQKPYSAEILASKVREVLDKK